MQINQNGATIGRKCFLDHPPLKMGGLKKIGRNNFQTFDPSRQKWGDDKRRKEKTLFQISQNGEKIGTLMTLNKLMSMMTLTTLTMSTMLMTFRRMLMMLTN